MVVNFIWEKKIIKYNNIENFRSLIMLIRDTSWSVRCSYNEVIERHMVVKNKAYWVGFVTIPVKGLSFKFSS